MPIYSLPLCFRPCSPASCTRPLLHAYLSLWAPPGTRFYPWYQLSLLDPPGPTKIDSCRASGAHPFLPHPALPLCWIPHIDLGCNHNCLDASYRSPLAKRFSQPSLQRQPLKSHKLKAAAKYRPGSFIAFLDQSEFNCSNYRSGL